MTLKLDDCGFLFGTAGVAVDPVGRRPSDAAGHSAGSDVDPDGREAAGVGQESAGAPEPPPPADARRPRATPARRQGQSRSDRTPPQDVALPTPQQQARQRRNPTGAIDLSFL